MKSPFVSYAILTIALTFCGCGSGNPTVSGTVTIDGNPVSPVLVVFAPKATGDSAVSGLVSSAVTDEDGHFTLKTKDGGSGAVVGQHSVGFAWADVGADSITSLKRSLNAMKGESPEEAAEIQRILDETESKLAGRPELPEGIKVDFEVVAGGTSEANFELNELVTDQQ